MGDGGAAEAAGQEALANGDWAAALDFFEQVEQPAAPVLEGRATAHWWRGEISDALSGWEEAYGAYVREDNVPAAFTVAITLSLMYQANQGNRAQSMGWAARAHRLVEGGDDPVIEGWLCLARATTAEDPADAVELGERALRAALAAGDRDLELCALAATGAAFVGVGEVGRGCELMDEALTGALAGEGQLDTVVYTSCLLMQSCVSCADFERVHDWSAALEPFIARYGCPYLNATCRAHHAVALIGSGRWAEAEDELRAARALATRALPRVQAEAAAFLAELRLAQGRPDEAREILAEHDTQAVVIPVLADAHLACGDPEVAASMARRHLSSAGGGPVAARVRETLVRALLALGREGDARDAAGEARDEADGEPSVLSVARAERSRARVHLASEAWPAAVTALNEALQAFARLGLAFEVARTRALLASALAGAEPAAAADEAQRALRAFDEMGARADADEVAAWLRANGFTPRRSAHRGEALLSAREAEVAAEVAAGRSNPEIAERLYISRRTVEHHVSSALTKLGLRNRAELAAWSAGRRGSVDQ